jgi:hypothetical protein
MLLQVCIRQIEALFRVDYPDTDERYAYVTFLLIELYEELADLLQLMKAPQPSIDEPRNKALHIRQYHNIATGHRFSLCKCVLVVNF